jgi:hypothetical protein
MMQATPAIGARVLTSDGAELGHVKEVSGMLFKIDAPMQTDYWLRTDLIVNTDGGVRLSVSRETLDDVKQKGPDDA